MFVSVPLPLSTIQQLWEQELLLPNGITVMVIQVPNLRRPTPMDQQESLPPIGSSRPISGVKIRSVNLSSFINCRLSTQVKIRPRIKDMKCRLPQLGALVIHGCHQRD